MAIFIPLVMLLILAALLTAVLGIHPEGAEPEEGQVTICLVLDTGLERQNTVYPMILQ